MEARIRYRTLIRREEQRVQTGRCVVVRRARAGAIRTFEHGSLVEAGDVGRGPAVDVVLERVERSATCVMRPEARRWGAAYGEVVAAGLGEGLLHAVLLAVDVADSAEGGERDGVAVLGCG